MITFETSVRVERPIEEVFAFVSDPLHVPAMELGRPDRARHVRGERASRARRTRCSENYRPARSRTSSRSSAASTPPSSPSAQRRDRRRFSTATDSPLTTPTWSSTSTPASRCPVRQPFSDRSRRAGSDEASTPTSPLSSTRSRRVRGTHSRSNNDDVARNGLEWRSCFGDPALIENLDGA